MSDVPFHAPQRISVFALQTGVRKKALWGHTRPAQMPISGLLGQGYRCPFARRRGHPGACGAGKVDRRARLLTHTHSAPSLSISSGLAFSLSLPHSQLLRSGSSSAPPRDPSPAPPRPPPARRHLQPFPSCLPLRAPPPPSLFLSLPAPTLLQPGSPHRPRKRAHSATNSKANSAAKNRVITAPARPGSGPRPAGKAPRPPPRLRAAPPPPPPADQLRARGRHGTRKRWRA